MLVGSSQFLSLSLCTRLESPKATLPQPGATSGTSTDHDRSQIVRSTELRQQDSPSIMDDKKYVCATCGRPFKTAGHRARHKRMHTGERQHKCPHLGCDMRFARRDNLQQHYRVHMPPGVKRVAGPAARAAMEQAGLLVNPHPKRKLSPSSLPDEEKKLP